MKRPKGFNVFEFSNYFMILIRSFISPFEMNKLNPFPALTEPFHTYFPLKFTGWD